MLACSSSYNLTLAISRVLIDRHLTFCSPMWPTRCNSARKWRGKKLEFQLSHRQPLRDLITLRSCDKLKHYIFTTWVLMTTKLGRMVTYPRGLVPIKSDDPWIAWSFYIMWQNKTTMSPQPQCLWPPNLTGS